VNETLVLDFDTRTAFDWQHYAFKVSDGEFDGIDLATRQGREGLAYGSGPFSPDDGQQFGRAAPRPVLEIEASPAASMGFLLAWWTGNWPT
jgi:hypothetical protein